MSDNYGKQQTLEGDEIEDTDEADDLNDFGEEQPWYETKGGYRRDVVTSLLQKAVRRSAEEESSWAAWELARSGLTECVFERLNLFVIEDLTAGHQAALLIKRYEELALERWEPESWHGRLCVIAAALTAARAPSSREATYGNDLFDKLAQDRVRAAQEDDHEMLYEPNVPEEELGPGGKYDMSLDKHTYPGAAIGRDWRHFRVHGARCGPNADTEVGEMWRRRMMEYDRYGYREPTMEFTNEEIQHALSPTDESDPWDEPADLLSESLDNVTD